MFSTDDGVVCRTTGSYVIGFLPVPGGLWALNTSTRTPVKKKLDTYPDCTILYM